MLYKTGHWLFQRIVNKKLLVEFDILSKNIDLFADSYVISSPSAWSNFTENYPVDAKRIILDAPLQLSKIKDVSRGISESHIVGIGGGRVVDCAKVVAKFAKKKCFIVPSILSTTAWLNPTSSLKIGNKVHHEKGRIDSILIDPKYIAMAPQHLNLGGLADILCGYNALSDWVLANQITGERMPKKAKDLVLEMCNHLKTKTLEELPITSDSVPFLINAFKEALGLCWGLLSGRPLEGSEHFLYYALEESYNQPMNHGSIIALNTLLCLRLRGGDALIDPFELRKFYDDLGISYTLRDQNIPSELYGSALESMPEFVIKRKLKFSLWNLENLYKSCSFQEILDWIS